MKSVKFEMPFPGKFTEEQVEEIENDISDIIQANFDIEEYSAKVILVLTPKSIKKVVIEK